MLYSTNKYFMNILCIILMLYLILYYFYYSSTGQCYTILLHIVMLYNAYYNVCDIIIICFSAQ